MREAGEDVATSARFDITLSVNGHSLGGTGDSYAHFSLLPPNFLRTCASDNRETRACCFLKFSRKRISFDNLIRFHDNNGVKVYSETRLYNDPFLLYHLSV